MSTALAGHDAKSDRADQMLNAYLDGFTVSEIAQYHGVTRRMVYIRLNALGVVFDVGRPDDIWSMPEDQRRIEITKRAARGAREALKDFPPISPLSTLFTADCRLPLTQCLQGQDAGY